MNARPPIAPGRVFRGRYVVQTVLGHGGFGATYLALDREAFDRRCVLKEILPERDADAKVRQLFEREARTLSQLRHPRIPRLDAFFVDDDRYYLVQEFVSGDSLMVRLKERGALPESEVKRIADEVLQILHYLHQRNPPVVHRDIKPSNIMVTDAGRCVVIDFGAVRAAAYSSTGPGRQGTVIASSGYTPPEQMLGRAFPASDLYSLGATLLHLLTGKHPLHWYNARERRWVYDRAVALSDGFAAILQRMLPESLSERYRSAQEVLDDLRQTGRNQTEITTAPQGTHPPTKPPGGAPCS